MRGLDLFCGAGGCSVGYARAGLKMTGVDRKPQPSYPFEFIQADALEYVAEHGHEYDFIHASPPCQVFTRARHLRDAQGKDATTPDLVSSTRVNLRVVGVPWVIENVEGAPVSGIILCGSMFGLRVRRHRVFESSELLFGGSCNHKGQGRPVGVYHRLGDNIPNGGRTAETLDEAQDAMGIDWMKFSELKEAVPPAYTQFIGMQLMWHLEGAA